MNIYQPQLNTPFKNSLDKMEIFSRQGSCPESPVGEPTSPRSSRWHNPCLNAVQRCKIVK
ncbi:unnamed protein product, partial [Larinioides sclopetarius]